MSEPDAHAIPVGLLPPHPLTDPENGEELFSTIVTLLSEGVVVQDAQGSIKACNPSAERILGLSRDQMLGRTSVDPRWQAIHPDGTPFPGDTHPAMIALRSGESQTGVIMGVHKPDETLTWIQVDAYPLPRPDAAAPHGVVSLFREITGQVLAEQALGESEERYRRLLMTSPDGISLVDQAGRILSCNERFAQMHGVDNSAKVIGRQASEFARPEAFAHLYNEVAAGLERGEKAFHNIEIEVLRADGTPFHAEYSVAQVPWLDAPHNVAYLSVVRDVSNRAAERVEQEHHRLRLEELVQERTRELEAEIAERKEAQRALETANSLLERRIHELSALQSLSRPISHTLPLNEIADTLLSRLVAIGDVDMAQVFLLRADQLHPLSAHTREGLLMSEPETFSTSECLCGLAARTGQSLYVGEAGSDVRCTRFRCKAAGLRSLAALPLRSQGLVIGVLVIGALAPDSFADRVTFFETAADQIGVRLRNILLYEQVLERSEGLEESVAERTRELQRERDRTRALLNTVGESVVVTDLEGSILFANPAALALTGNPRDELLGQPIWGQWSAQTLAEVLPSVQEALRHGQTWRGEASAHRKDGSTYSAAVTCTPLWEADREVSAQGAVWVQRDITSLVEAARLKDRFASNVSHQLRTPVSIIALSCDSLQTFYGRLDDSERLRIVQDIHEQTRVLNHLVEDILTLSRVDSRQHEQMRLVDLARVVGEEVETQRCLAEERGQQLIAVTGAPLHVVGNEVQLRQVVRNLLDNAIKYAPADGRISCTCGIRPGTLATTPEGDSGPAEACAVVEVNDSGPGIAAEHVPYIFDRFFRVDPEGELPGTGLGLAIAQELVLLHRGRIDVTSVPGQGSTFTIYLPLPEAGKESRG